MDSSTFITRPYRILLNLTLLLLQKHVSAENGAHLDSVSLPPSSFLHHHEGCQISTPPSDDTCGLLAPTGQPLSLDSKIYGPSLQFYITIANQLRVTYLALNPVETDDDFPKDPVTCRFNSLSIYPPGNPLSFHLRHYPMPAPCSAITSILNHLLELPVAVPHPPARSSLYFAHGHIARDLDN